MARSVNGTHVAATNRLPTKAGWAHRQSAQIGDIEFTIGAEAANVIEVTIQVKDVQNRNLDRRVNVMVTVHDTSWNGTLASTLEQFAATTGTIITEHVANHAVLCQTDATGKLVLDLTESTGADTYFVNAEAGGVLVQSAQIDFAA